jgi:hypothetical protein
MLIATFAPPAERRQLHSLLWGLQSTLAGVFLITGVIKLMLPLALVHDHLPWATAIGEPFIRALGACELAAVWGLMVPGLTRSFTRLVPITAVALASLTLLAVTFHVLRNEPHHTSLPLMLAAGSMFVAWGRARLPIAPLT